jgi:hypothetical protein
MTGLGIDWVWEGTVVDWTWAIERVGRTGRMSGQVRLWMRELVLNGELFFL